MVRDRGRAHRSAGLNLDPEHAAVMPGRPPPDPSLRDAADVAIEVGVDATVGLSAAEAAARLARGGPNELRAKPPVPVWRRILAQFQDPLATAALLASGRVLVAGGMSSRSGYLAAAETYDPATGSFAPTGSMVTARTGATATVLADGRILVAGGADGSGNATATVELFDPATGTFGLTGQMTTPRKAHTATLIDGGRVLVIGGVGPLATAELYDPATGTFSRTGPMATARTSHAATLLPDGRVLVTGGYDGTEYLSSAEIYDPKTEAFGPANQRGVRLGSWSSTPVGDQPWGRVPER